MPDSMTRFVLGEIYKAWRRQDLDLLGSYLPNDFEHDIRLPTSVLPQAGLIEGKKGTLHRLRLIAEAFEIVRFDTGRLMSAPNRAAAHVPICYWHRQTGYTLETTMGMLWDLEEGWPTRLVEYHDIERVGPFMEKLGWEF